MMPFHKVYNQQTKYQISHCSVDLLSIQVTYNMEYQLKYKQKQIHLPSYEIDQNPQALLIHLNRKIHSLV
jgi:hypothetical protein